MGRSDKYVVTQNTTGVIHLNIISSFMKIRPNKVIIAEASSTVLFDILFKSPLLLISSQVALGFLGLSLLRNNLYLHQPVTSSFYSRQSFLLVN